MDELTNLLASLTLMLQANMNTPKREPARTYDPRCTFCDSTNHRKGDCPELKDAMQKGLVSINANNRIINAKTGEEIPTMFGKGGMKALLASQPTSTPVVPTTTASSNGIMLNSRYGSIGEGTILNTTLDFENNIRTDEIIDVEVRVGGGVMNEVA